jgi:hypothetical protein
MKKLSFYFLVVIFIASSIASSIQAQVMVVATAGLTGPIPYPNLTSAFNAINAGTHQGTIGIGIMTNCTEPGTAVLNSSGAGSASYISVTISPIADAVTISGATVSGKGLIELSGVNNVIIDGDNPNTGGINRNLTITNTASNTTTFTSVVRIATSPLLSAANNNTIKNCILNGSATGRNIPAATTITGSEYNTYGILAAGGAPNVDPTIAPDPVNTVAVSSGPGISQANLLIENNLINTAARGISANGASFNVFPSLIIRNNTIGNPTVGAADQVYSNCISIAGTTGSLIEGNTLYLENYIQSTNNTGSCISVGANYPNCTGATIQKNNIGRNINNNPGSYPAYGVYLAFGNNHIVRNNFIGTCRQSQVTGTGAFSVISGAFGILVASGSGHNIDYNTIHFTGAQPGSTNTSLIACIAIVNTTSTGINVRNNIFSNQLTGGNSTLYNTVFACVYLPSGANSAMNLTWNNNAYYQGSLPYSGIAQVSIVGSAANLYKAANFIPGATAPANNFRSYSSTLSTAGTNDNASLASIVVPPLISNSNFHINTGAANVTDVDGKGTPIASTTTDIDGGLRDLTTTDIGADEFIIGGCVSASGGTITPATYTLCEGATVGLTSAGATSGPGIVYQWLVSNTPGGPYSNVIGGTGANTTSYTSSTLASGTYYYVLQTNCTIAPITGLSNEVIVTVNPTPSASASSNSPICEGATLTLTGATDIGTTFSWSGPGGFTSLLQSTSIGLASLSASGTYSFVAIAANCTSSVATTVVSVGPLPTGGIATATDTIICMGDAIDLDASANPYSVVLLTENFNSGAPLWTRINNSTGGSSGNAAWTDRPDGFVYAAGTPYHSNDYSTFIQTNSEAQGSGSTARTIMQSPAFATTGATNINVSFYQYYRDINDNGDSAVVEASLDGTTWTFAGAYTTTTGSENNFANANIVLPAIFNNQPTVKIRFRYIGTWDWYWSIDNVSISAPTNNYAYAWTSTPVGFTSSSQNPAGVVPTSNTSYEVTITNTFGCTTTASKSITVNPLPVIGYTATPNDSICPGDSVTLDGTGATSYAWDNGVIDAVAFHPSSTDIYTVTGTDALGCSNTSSVTITIGQPTVDYTILTNDTVCEGDLVTFYGTGAVSYTWTGGVVDGIAAPTLQGIYTVTGTDGIGCTNTAVASLTVNSLPNVSYTSTANDTICTGTGVTLSGAGDLMYVWSGGVNNDMMFIPLPGYYTYIVTGTDTNGCANTDTTFLAVGSAPNISFTITANDTVCPGGSVTLSGTGATTFTWSDGVIDGVPFIPAASASYMVTASDPLGCTSVDYAVVIVSTVPSVNLGADIIQSNPPAILDAGTGFSSYLWNTTANTQTISVSTNGQYIVTVANDFGCTDADTIHVTFTSGVFNPDGSNTTISLYPNPSTGPFSLNIQNLQTSDLYIDIVDMTGRIVHNKYIGSVNGGIIEPFDLSDLRAGTYILRMNANGKKDQIRFIISQ